MDTKRPLTLSDELRTLLPSSPEQAMTSKALFARCDLAQTSEDVSKALSSLYRFGEVLRTDATPYAYWRNTAVERQRVRTVHREAKPPHPHMPIAAQAAAQPAVAQNTGSVPSAPPPLLSAGGHAVPAGAAAPTAAPRATSDGFRCAIYDDGELVMEVDGGEVRLSRERTFRLCAYLERMVEVPGS